MTTAREYLARYNAAAEKLGRPTIKSWKAATAGIQVKCNQIETELAEHLAEKPKLIVNDLSSRVGEFAEWCRQNGFNPKTARAKLRKANHKRNGSRYELNAAAVAIVKGEAK